MIEDIQTAVLDPVRMMWANILGFLPNLVSAIIILLAGWVAAPGVQRFVTRFLPM